MQKHKVNLGQSGLPFQIKIKMVWLIDIPDKEEYNRLHGVNMVPFRVMTGQSSREVPASMSQMASSIRGSIKEKLRTTRNSSRQGGCSRN